MDRRTPRQSDIVAVQTHDGRRLLKRYHEVDGEVLLTSINTNVPLAAVRLTRDDIDSIRIVVGTLFE